jgi:glycosyltransferase involved in cell wall biosynthesis
MEPPRHLSAAGVRLALFCDSYLPQLNGVSLLLERLVQAVQDRGGAVRVYTTSDPAVAEADDVRRWPSVAFWAYPEHRLAMPLQPRVRRELRRWGATLVHAASPFGLGLAARGAARVLGLPFVTSYHTNWSAYSKYYLRGTLSKAAWPYLRWFHNAGVRTYCPTRAVQRELAARGFQRTAIWSRGVDHSAFSPSFRSQPLRDRLGVTDDMVLAIYVGRLGPEKGLGVGLAGIQAVMRAAPGRVKLAVAGDGPYEAEARDRAPAGTVFLGRLTGRELSEFYASADIFLFPSETDTFGNVLLEAMASGLSVVGADVGPTRELLGDKGGLTFQPGDSASLANRILELVSSPERRRVLARHAVAAAREYTWDRVFDDLIADYSMVQGVSTPARGLPVMEGV